MKKITKSIYILLGVFLLFVTTSASSQEILKPELGFSSACSGNETDFPVTFRYTAPFNADNVFTIELSDADGNWGSPNDRGTVTGENNNFTFTRSFQLPDNTFGTNYKIRLISSSPAMTGPESDPFEAYKYSTDTLILNNFDHVYLCGSGTSAEISLNTDQEGKYDWYKDGGFITTTTEPKLVVSEAGKYGAKIDYGACGIGRESTLIDVVVITEADAQIKGGSPVEICGDEAHTFEAEFENIINDRDLLYNWYFNDNQVQSSNSPTYTTPTAGQFGTYRLEIVTGTTASSCTTVSNNVELQQQTTAGFTVTPNADNSFIVLPGETRQLCIEHDASSATIQWYRDTRSMGSSANDLCITARVAGEYFARVTQSTGGSCDAIVDSGKITLVILKSFNVEIRPETDYEECTSTTTKLSIVGVKAIGQDDNEYDLTTDQIAMLSYQWKKNGVDIPSATSDEHSVNSYADNGIYTLTVSIGAIPGSGSNELDIKLVEVPEITSTSTSNSLCDGGAITYTINNPISGYTYQWIKDGTDDVTPANPEVLEVTEIGEYVLMYSGFGCDNELAPIVVVPFDDSAVTITPSEKVVMDASGSVTITASGGESYEWYQGEDTSGTLLSTTEELNVNSLGFYTVLVKVGDCSVLKNG